MQSLWGACSLELILVILGSDFEVVGIFLVERLHWEFLLVILEKGSEFEIVLSIQIRLDSNVVLDELKELLFKLVDLLGNEKWVDECKVSICEISIIPNFLRDQKRAQKHWPPVCWLKWHLSECNEPVDIDQADNAAFWTELGAIVESLYKLLNVLNCWRLSQKSDSLAVKCIGFLENVLLLAEEE